MNSSIVPCFASNKCDINSLENDFTWNIWQWKCLELARLETFVRDIGTFLKDYSTLCVTSLFANPFHHVRDPRWILALFLFSRTFFVFFFFPSYLTSWDILFTTDKRGIYMFINIKFNHTVWGWFFLILIYILMHHYFYYTLDCELSFMTLTC